MEESKRQKQVAALLNEELSDIFRRVGLNVIQNGMISIAQVKVTPDLLEARIYLSFYNIADKADMMKRVQDKAWEIKRELSARVGKQLRRMPELQFFMDDTLDYVFKMEALFDQLNKDEPAAPRPPAGEDGG
ncbi:MAG: 30S ribosome-binding factor RbfA [Chitinophagaceae bacterium]|nr:30S ribosome-binding factor RbfA [Chitinophagaceae bacterium]